jgi:hypothetical protein
LGAAYEVLGRVFRFGDFALLGTTIGQYVGFVKKCGIGSWRLDDKFIDK